jgi:hypothetical protein
MRSAFGLAASALAALAAIIASLDGDGDLVPFFVCLTFAGGLQAWATHPPFVGRRRVLARGIAVLWLVAAVWISLLLLIYLPTSAPPPGQQASYLGLPATGYHVLGLYGGLVLILLSALAPDRWLVRSQRAPGGASRSER